ncbi:GumC family protein [Pelagibacterium lentulum]|uniref:Chain-length determining protein n=1 Tax=Pelagibacterium lentulum TaxID=2029865 RepID=A0A916RD38_9HYPH|nr:GumC family protein [Pelagibacterium lentulum]GGA51256.1 chain-length determining protein [Pelagibacterium lentulum]
MTTSAPVPEVADASIDAGVVLMAVLRRIFRIGLVTLLLCVATYVLLMFVPRVYESTASILVEPRSNIFTRATSDLTTGYIVDDAQVSSQIELIKSRGTLLDAIEATGLRDVSEFAPSGGLLSLIGLGRSPQETDTQIISAVNDRLVVARERDSRLVTIAFRSTDPERAAEVANAIAAAHLARRAGQQLSDTAEATVWLEREIDRLRGRVVEAEGRVAEFRVANDLFVGQNNTSLVDQQLSNIATQITSAAERRSAAQSRAQLIRSLLDAGQSVAGVQDVQDSPVVQQLSQEMARLQGERAQRSATLLSNHPTIRALDAQIGEVNQQIASEGRRVAEALEAQSRIESELERSLQEELDRLKVAAGSATREGVSLAELEREAAAQRDLLNAYLLRYSEAAARTEQNSALPDVRIVSEAAPSASPVSPKTTLILVAMLLASLTLQVGAIIFSELLSGRAIVEKRRTRAEAPNNDNHQALSIHGNAPKAQSETISPMSLRITQADTTKLDASIDRLIDTLLAKNTRRLVVASVDEWRDSSDFAERLSARLVAAGQSVAEIDAASHQNGIELGLTDLTAGDADFGDIVHRGNQERFAFVPWGQNAGLAPQTDKLKTLVEALSDIYEVVIVVTGKVGMRSTLPLFAGLEAGCVLLASSTADAQRASGDIEALGFAPLSIVATSELRSEVA